MTYLQALVLGLLQGLTEFLPVSSSGHLQGVPYLLGWDSASLSFDVLLHTATLLAVVLYFRQDLWGLATGALGLGEAGSEARRRSWILIGLLAVGSIPAAVAGLVFADFFEATFDSPRLVALFLYVTAAVLWAAEHIRARRAGASGSPDPDDATPAVDPEHAIDVEGALPTRLDTGRGRPGRGEGPRGVRNADDIGRPFDGLRWSDALAIGCAQALAIFPGVSRAGSTIAAGMAMGLSRTAAARFSFLLSIPVILGATVFTLRDVGTLEAGTLPFGIGEYLVGMVAAALSGYWAIRFLLRLVVRRDLLGFAAYVAVFGTVLLVATFVSG